MCFDAKARSLGEVVLHRTSTVLPLELLTADHPIASFNSREPELNAWLTKRALHNASQGFSRTYVTCSADRSQVVGYYCLASGSVQRAVALKKLQRNAPDPIPVLIIGRLAVDQAWERRGVGSALLAEAVTRSYLAGQIAGVAAVLAHCINEQATVFYHKGGFHPSPLNPLTMMLSMAEIEHALTA